MKALNGYKTYLVGILSIALGVYYSNMELVMLGLAAMGLRHAMK